MKLTTQTKIYLGMLAVAGLALIADRSFFSTNVAAAKPAAIKKSIAHSPVKIEVANTTDAGASFELRDLSGLSRRLEAAVGDSKWRDETKDPFAPPAVWLARAAENARRSAPSPLDRFRARHHLLAVMTGGHAALAIVDGKTLAVGQSFNGFQLVHLTQQSATFESSDGTVELTIPK